PVKALAVLAGVLAALAVPAAWGASAGTVKLGESSNGKTVHVHVGDVVLVSLSENPSTGFYWDIHPYDRKVLSAHGHTYVQDPAPPGMVGVGGTYTYHFTAARPGTTTVTFSLEPAARLGHRKVVAIKLVSASP